VEDRHLKDEIASTLIIQRKRRVLTNAYSKPNNHKSYVIMQEIFMASLETETMANYWVDAIRNNKDIIRKYVTNPALFDRLASLESGLKVLDSGCGEGYVSRELARRGHKAFGIDVSQYIIKAAKEATVGNDGYIRGDVCQMPFRDESFDCVVSNFLLVELEEPENFIKEVERVLKSKGRFIFQTPSFSFYFKNRTI
jgi:SAM-dependent methyltransferase